MLSSRLVSPLKSFISPALELPMKRKLPRFTRPFVELSFTRGSYTVRTVANHEEFLNVLRLRFEVFHREYMKKKWVPVGFDIEAYDRVADHLAVFHNDTGKLIGCYRVISSAWTDLFYSQSEFDLSQFMALPGEKLELSRACIHKDFRSGIVLNLLWRGVMEYVQQTNARYLFGIPSMSVTDPVEAAKAYRYLEAKGATDMSLTVFPHTEFTMPGFNSALANISADSLDTKLLEQSVPALFKTYLKAGAKVYGHPALDTRFKCIDFFTVLDMAQLSQRYDKRYRLC